MGGQVGGVYVSVEGELLLRERLEHSVCSGRRADRSMTANLDGVQHLRRRLFTRGASGATA